MLPKENKELRKFSKFLIGLLDSMDSLAICQKKALILTLRKSYAFLFGNGKLRHWVGMSSRKVV